MELLTYLSGLLVLQIVSSQDEYCPQDYLPPATEGEVLPCPPSYFPQPSVSLPYLSPPIGELPYLPPSTCEYLPPQPYVGATYPSVPLPYQPESQAQVPASTNCLPDLPPLPDISLGLQATECGDGYESAPCCPNSQPPYPFSYSNSEYGYCPAESAPKKCKCGKLPQKDWNSGLKQKILLKKIKKLNKIIGKLYKNSVCKDEGYNNEYDGCYAPYPATFY